MIDAPETPLVYVRYRDALLFRNCNAKILQPNEREAVGWILKENNEALWLVFDRSVQSESLEKVCSESGLVVLRSDVLELKRLC
jgi:hypothetical protein